MVVVLDVLAIVQIWRTKGLTGIGRRLWSVVVVVLPFIGAIIWLVLWTIIRSTGSEHVR